MVEHTRQAKERPIACFIQVDVSVRMTIPAQQFPKAQCICRILRANYNDIAQLPIDEPATLKRTN